MFTRNAAIRRPPAHAEVPEFASDILEDSLDLTEAELQDFLDRGFAMLDRSQPALAAWLSDELGDNEQSLGQSVGYFLCVTVFLMFREAFSRRMRRLDRIEVDMVSISVQTDLELRRRDPIEALTTEAWLAMIQPVVMAFVAKHIEEAAIQGGEEGLGDDFSRVHQAVIVQVLALSYAVEAPLGKATHAPLLS